MRRLALSTALPASVERAWATLVDIERWPNWGQLVVKAEGDFVTGSRWTMELQDPNGSLRQMRPYFVSMTPPQSIVFETRIGPRWVIKLRHCFKFESSEPGNCVLWQRFEASGLLVPPMWTLLRSGMSQFEMLGADLASHLLTDPGPRPLRS